jgi:hypothetical protein
MAYATYSEIEKDFKAVTFTDTSLVTSSAVTGFITEHDALIDSYIGMRYETPVTTGGGLNLLKLLSRSLTVLRVKKILEVVQAQNSELNQNVVSVILSQKMVMDILEQIQKGNRKLVGATLLSTASGFASYNNSNEVEFTFKKDEQQW